MKKRNRPSPEILISRIVPNPEQPRKFFEPTELEELAGSIREHGVIELRKGSEAGDRRQQ